MISRLKLFWIECSSASIGVPFVTPCFLGFAYGLLMNHQRRAGHRVDGRQALRESHVEGNAAGANNLASIRCSRCLVYSYSSSVANLGRVATPEMDAFEQLRLGDKSRPHTRPFSALAGASFQ
jgi:hypothetical protein